MRKYLWANINIDGDTLCHTGTGGELFRVYEGGSIIFLVSIIALVVSIVVQADLNTLQRT